MSLLQTEHAFTLPLGYLDDEGTVHRDGLMRLATALDEIAPLRDARVDRNEAYATVILLSRVVVSLGDLAQVTPKTVERLFAADFAFLQDFYNEVNQIERTGEPITCPECAHVFEVMRQRSGGSPATPSTS